MPMRNNKLEQFLDELIDKSAKASLSDYPQFRDWLAIQISQNLDLVRDRSFFLFLPSQSHKNKLPRILSYKIFKSPEDYMEFGMDMPGTIQFCGFSGSEPGSVKFGVTTQENVSLVEFGHKSPESIPLVTYFLDYVKLDEMSDFDRNELVRKMFEAVKLKLDNPNLEQGNKFAS